MEDKALGALAAVAFDCYSNHDNYKDWRVKWLFLTTLESLFICLKISVKYYIPISRYRCGEIKRILSSV